MLQVTSRGSLNSSFNFLRLYLQRIRNREYGHLPEEIIQMTRGYDNALNDMQYGVRRITNWLYCVPKGRDFQGRVVSMKDVREFIRGCTNQRK